MQQATLWGDAAVGCNAHFRYSCPASAPSSAHATAIHCTWATTGSWARTLIWHFNQQWHDFTFPAFFFFFKGGWLFWYRSEYRCKNSHVGKTERVRQWTVGTATETAQWRNTLDQKYSKQRCGIEPLPFAIFNWSKHPTWKCLTNWGRGENKKGFLCCFSSPSMSYWSFLFWI